MYSFTVIRCRDGLMALSGVVGGGQIKERTRKLTEHTEFLKDFRLFICISNRSELFLILETLISFFLFLKAVLVVF